MLTLSAAGSIWVSDDPVIGNALIRQRIIVDADIKAKTLKDAEGNLLHQMMKDNIEDDVYDINATSILPPADSETNKLQENVETSDEGS